MPLFAQYDDVRLRFVVIVCNFMDKIIDGNREFEKLSQLRNIVIFATALVVWT